MNYIICMYLIVTEYMLKLKESKEEATSMFMRKKQIKDFTKKFSLSFVDRKDVGEDTHTHTHYKHLLIHTLLH